MKKDNLLKVEAFISFKGQFLQINEFGGMNQDLILFNPETVDGILDYKIQLAEKLFLKKIGTDKFVSIKDMKEHFIIINHKGNEIARSTNLHPEIVTMMLEEISNPDFLSNSKENYN